MGKSTSRCTDEARCLRILAFAQHYCGAGASITMWPRAFQDALVAFRARRDEYRQRFERESATMSHQESVALIKSYPCLAGDSEELAVAMIVADCLDLCNGQWVILEEPLKELCAAWQGRDGENDPWQRFLAQEAIDVLGVVSCPDKRVSRPRGRFDVRANMFRDTAIGHVLSELQGCGLQVSSIDSPSLTGAMAEAWNIPQTTIEDVWKNKTPNRTDKHPRTSCAGCGKNPAGEDARRDEHGDIFCVACQRGGINS